MIKYNEALTISKTYQTILSKLKEERTAYDKQLASLEQQVNSKGIELEQMLLLSNDANHAKSLSKNDLNKQQVKINEMGQTRMQ